MEKYYRAKDAAIKTWYKNACVKMGRVERLVRDIDTARLFKERKQKEEALNKYRTALEAVEEARAELEKVI